MHVHVGHGHSERTGRVLRISLVATMLHRLREAGLSKAPALPWTAGKASRENAKSVRRMCSASSPPIASV